MPSKRRFASALMMTPTLVNVTRAVNGEVVVLSVLYKDRAGRQAPSWYSLPSRRDILLNLKELSLLSDF